MSWKLKEWTCGGYRAEREDGEIVFIYKRPPWGTGRCGLRNFYELRSRGLLIGRITEENSWRPLVTAEWLAETDRLLNETDLLEITAALLPS
ncbi:MAG: hypothetical protein COX65_00435 [Elusimicrobia bacterium CG_4_10_14_0_2_um_filter_56_8]|nr:MAG: hypothetical protein AUJ51_11060 [Elusimicrobia bacterium CG1_02_56_21]PJA17835.1 MAG: hypothetical protein COX65_00435 [Elusimicrobia bacterium CG_4_10_14_0_2_um_filter_56_8]